jgi:hypothetical protein
MKPSHSGRLSMTTRTRTIHNKSKAAKPGILSWHLLGKPNPPCLDGTLSNTTKGVKNYRQQLQENAYNCRNRSCPLDNIVDTLTLLNINGQKSGFSEGKGTINFMLQGFRVLSLSLGIWGSDRNFNFQFSSSSSEYPTQ